MKYYLYIIETTDNKLYCGIALNPIKRFLEHKESKKGAKYTKAHPPKEIVYLAEFVDKSSALKEEIRIKALKRSEKLNLIEENKTQTEILYKTF